MRKLLATGFVYFLFALVLTWPLPLAFGNALVDPVDPVLNTWILAWEHHALLTDLTQFFNANIFYPYQATLLYSETLLVPSLLLLPVQVASGNAILTHNLLMLLGLTMTASSGYLLGRWLFRNDWAGWVLGGVLAFNAYTLSNLGQAQLLHLGWLPLALLYLGKLLRAPRPRFALMMALYLALQFYTTIYYGIFGLMVCGLVGGGVWLLHSYPTWRVRWQALGWLGSGMVAAVMLSLPLAIPYYRLSERFGYTRTLDDAWPFSASLEMWTSAPVGHWLYGAWFGKELPTIGFYPVDALMPGVVLLVMAVAGVMLWGWEAWQGPRAARWRVRWPLLLLCGVGGFFVLSLGPFLQWETLAPDFAMRLPYAWLHEWVPGFQALRAPGRFAIVVYLGLAVAAAFAIGHVRHSAWRSLFLVILAAETLVIQQGPLFVPTVTADQHAAYQWLAVQPTTALLELPIPPTRQGQLPIYWVETQFNSIGHWHATPVGYSGFFPPRDEELHGWLAAFPRAEVVAYLQASGVEWVMVNGARMNAAQVDEIEAASGEAGWATTRFGEVSILHLPRVEDVPLPQGENFFIPDVGQAGGSLEVGVILTSTMPVPLVVSNDLETLQVVWLTEGGIHLARDVHATHPFFVEQIAISSITIPVPEQVGIYTLQIYRAAQLLSSAMVNVNAEVAPPERVLVPLLGVDASIACAEGENQIQLSLRTVGWYDEPFTLSARVVDQDGGEVARSSMDVEFAPDLPRRNLLHTDRYVMPLDAAADAVADALSDAGRGPLAINLVAYRWQQAAERVVARSFVTHDGRVVDMLRLPLTSIATCQ